MLYNRCTGIYKFGNNTYPRRIRRRSNIGHIFRGKRSASYGPGNTVNFIYLNSPITPAVPNYKNLIEKFVPAFRDSKFPRISRSWVLCYRLHKTLLPVRTLSHINLMHSPLSYDLNMHINLKLPFTPRFSKWVVSIRFSHQTFTSTV
jgi:hypothetical protein